MAPSASSLNLNPTGAEHTDLSEATGYSRTTRIALRSMVRPLRYAYSTCLSDEDATSLLRPLGNRPHEIIVRRQIWSITAASTSCSKSISKLCTDFVVHAATWDTKWAQHGQPTWHEQRGTCASLLARIAGSAAGP